MVVEIVSRRNGPAEIRVFALAGHAGLGWKPVAKRSAGVSAGEYLAFARAVDEALARAEALAGGVPREVISVCADGRAYVSERVRQGRVVTLTGSCSTPADPHPNAEIACRVQRLVDRHLGRDERFQLIDPEHCPAG